MGEEDYVRDSLPFVEMEDIIILQEKYPMGMISEVFQREKAEITV